MSDVFPPSLESLGRAARVVVDEAAAAVAAMDGFVEHSDPGTYLRSLLRDVMLAYLDDFHIEPKDEEQALEALRGIVDGMVEHVQERKKVPALSVVRDDDGE